MSAASPAGRRALSPDRHNAPAAQPAEQAVLAQAAPDQAAPAPASALYCMLRHGLGLSHEQAARHLRQRLRRYFRAA